MTYNERLNELTKKIQTIVQLDLRTAKVCAEIVIGKMAEMYKEGYNTGRNAVGLGGINDVEYELIHLGLVP